MSNEDKPGIDAIRARESAVATIPPCDLSQYRSIVKKLPRPSEEQIDNYVEFVSEAHSWYKHLPLLPPGIPFRFFIDPFAGYDRVIDARGRVRQQERTENTPKFHYTWMTTATYHRRFGHLAYDADAGLQFFVMGAGILQEYAERPIFSTEESAYHIPSEVAEVGMIPLTAIVHQFASQSWVWQLFYHPEENRSWPSETGGERTLEQILAACKRELSPESQPEGVDYYEMALLLEPERRRLQEEMGKTIRRMVQLVYG